MKFVKFNEHDFKERVKMCMRMVCENENVVVQYIPISVSNKMTKTLGKFMYMKSARRPKELRFQAKLLQGYYSLDDVDSIILHEVVHYVQFMQDNGISDGHGYRFKAMCHRNNCKNDGTKAVGLQVNKELEQIEKVKKQQNAKYVLECRKCGHMFYKDRISGVVKNPSNYRCQCGGSLTRIR